jgi:hypothetical protein
MLKILSMGTKDFKEGRHKPADQVLNNLRQKVSPLLTTSRKN